MFQCFISFPVDAQLICAFVFCMCKNAIQFVLDISLISSFFLYVYSYTAKFVLDLLEIRKVMMSFICQRLYNATTHIWRENNWSQFTQFTLILQE